MRITLEMDEPYARQLVADMRETGTHEALPNLVDVADSIAAQIPKPQPEEPKGLGAVVRDVNDRLYVRNHQGREPWIWQTNRPVDPRYSWNELKVTEVLSKGVEV